MTPAEDPRAEPLWRDEFSLYAGEDRYVTRRQMAKFLVLTSFGMLVGNVWIFLRTLFQRSPGYPARTVGRVRELPIGGVGLFHYPAPADPCILVRTGLDSYVAYSQKCTHLSCAVYFEAETNRLACPCHVGYFAVEDGRVLQGPPPRPLPRIVLERRGDELVAVGVDLQREA